MEKKLNLKLGKDQEVTTQRSIAGNFIKCDNYVVDAGIGRYRISYEYVVDHSNTVIHTLSFYSICPEGIVMATTNNIDAAMKAIEEDAMRRAENFEKLKQS